MSSLTTACRASTAWTSPTKWEPDSRSSTTNTDQTDH